MRISGGLPRIFAALICLLPVASYSQGMGFGGGREIIKIPPAVRAALHDYLAEEYQRKCPEHKKNPPDACQQIKPLYESSALSAADSHPLPPDVISKLGFIEPGTEYVRAGFVVYLIRLPRRIILDSVSVHGADTSSNIQW